MKIKYNEWGEVVSVNGLTTGQHLGTPMQDALCTPEDNAPYCEEHCTITRCCNTVEDLQPNPIPIPVTAENDGEFLRVVDGMWTSEALTDVSEVGA